MSRLLVLMTMCAAACTSVQDSSPGDAATARDAKGASGDGGAATSGACKSHLTVAVAANGTRFESTSYFVVRPDIHPGDDFKLVACDYVQTPPATAGGCPTGYTCTDSGDALPAGRSCTAATGTGSFIGDALYFSCGYESRVVDAQGTETSHDGGHYMTVSIAR